MNRKVLFGILNWGLGHATRSIPLIKAYIEKDFEVFIASDGDALVFLKKEFPDLKFYELPGYNVKYPYKSIFFNILRYLPNIFNAIIKENKEIEKIVENIKPDLIISDNRYGVRNKKVKSIIITHQINLRLANKFLTKTGTIFNERLIRLFDELWIPDLENNLLAGELSIVPDSFNYRYLGALSRFEHAEIEKKYNIAVVLSGPEPQRTYFEKKILRQFEKVNLKSIIVLGKMDEEKEWNLNDNVKVKSHALSGDLNDIINQSELIISRSGYSTVMDLFVLNKKAIFVPTPGQSEQEYLAEYLMQKKMFYSMEQELFDIDVALQKAEDYSPVIVDKKLVEILESINYGLPV